MLKMSSGVVIPNILMSTRGIFIVIISAVLTHRGSTMLETQSKIAARRRQPTGLSDSSEARCFAGFYESGLGV